MTKVIAIALGCGDGGAESGDGGAASASPRVEEPPPVPPAAAAPAAPAAPADTTAPAAPTATLPVPTDVSPTADSWEAEADDALLTPEENNEPEDEEIEQQVCNTFLYMTILIGRHIINEGLIILLLLSPVANFSFAKNICVAANT